jgi:cell division septation protein DedD
MRSWKRRLISAAAAGTACLAPAAAGADVRSGIAAWEKGEYGTAVAEWRPLAEKGDPDAQFNLGQAYKLGRGVPSDLKIAQTWYEKASAKGHEQAQANLGLILFQNGSQKAAMPWIQKAADRGDARAQYILGTALFNGDIIGRDWVKAYALMTRAASQGLPQASASLEQMNQHIPLEQRQQAIGLARKLETGTKLAAASPPPPKAAAKPAIPAPAAAKPLATPAIAASVGGKWRVQLGAYATAAAAQGQWTTISRRIGALGGLQPSYEAAGKFTRLRVGPLANRAAADRLCAAAKAAGQACFPVGP